PRPRAGTRACHSPSWPRIFGAPSRSRARSAGYTGGMPFRMNFRDTEHSEAVQTECEALAQGVRDEFPETSRIEVTVGHDRGEYEAHVHVTGKDVDFAASATSRDTLTAAREAFHKAHAQLRKHHDKAIFKHRRDGHER